MKNITISKELLVVAETPHFSLKYDWVDNNLWLLLKETGYQSLLGKLKSHDISELGYSLLELSKELID